MKRIDSLQFIGIDCSSKAIHAALLDCHGELVALFKWFSTQKNTDQRFFEIVGDFEEFVLTQSPLNTVVAVEAPIYIQNFIATVSIAQVVAGVKKAVYLRGIPFDVVGNTTWKKRVVGSGRSSKHQIKDFAIRRWNMDKSIDQDYYDAACIALWGLIKEDETRASSIKRSYK